MSIARKYSLSAVELADDAVTLISGITTQGLSTGSQVDQEATSGELYTRWAGLSGQIPNGRFATYHLATALGAIGFGLSIATLTNGLNLWLQKHAEAGTRGGAGTNRKYNLTEGLIIPTTLSCSHGPNQHATVQYQVLPTWDGTNDPFTITEAQNLPTAEDDDERFTLGPCTIESKTLTQIRQFDIDFGINAVAEGGDGDLYPTFISIETINPRLTLRGIDPEWLKAATVPLCGLAITHANTAIYLRKRTATGFVANGTAEHIKFTAAGLAYVEEAIDATGTGAAETNVVIPLTYDGTNAPLVINTASAIS